MALEYKWLGGELHAVVEGEDVLRLCTTEQRAKRILIELTSDQLPEGKYLVWHEMNRAWAVADKPAEDAEAGTDVMTSADVRRSKGK